MIDYSFLRSKEAAEIARKKDDVTRLQEVIQQESLNKPYTRETSRMIHDDWILHHLEMKYLHQLVPIIGIRIETWPFKTN